MNILLINPINRSYVVIPSLGLGYLAAILIKKGHDVTILNCIKERSTYESFTTFIKNRHFDIIGIQVFSYDLNSVKKHLGIIRSYSPGTITIVGGPHPSGDPVGTMSVLENTDFAFQGEAEIGLPLLVDQLISGSSDFTEIPGLIWRNDDNIRVNPKKFVTELDSIDLPAWNIIKPETYPEAPHGAFTKNFPSAPIVTSRGCPSKCTFCAGSTINGRNVRRRSVDNVVQELQILKARGIKEFHIEDENFTLSKEYVLAFCARIEEAKLGMSWSLPSGVRLDTLTSNLLQAMEKSGCYSLAVGIEFGTDRLLQLTRKGTTIKNISEGMSIFSGSNIKVTGFFLLGVPGETRDEIMKTVRFSRILPLNRAQFNIFAPLPGSSEWDRLMQRGVLEFIETDRLHVHDVSYVEGDITRSELKKIQRRAVLGFYLRPSVLVNIALEIRSLKHLRHIINRLVDTLWR